VLGRSLLVFKDSKEKPVSAPLDWVELARDDKPLTDMLKAFIRRARGPATEEKTKAIQLVEQALRWAAKPAALKGWPSAETLMKEGIKPGPALGKELKKRQWVAFWASRPA
jgi:hypothetical protein